MPVVLDRQERMDFGFEVNFIYFFGSLVEIEVELIVSGVELR